MIKLHDVETGAPLGSITEEQLKLLVEHLEEESPEDREYYIDEATLEMFDEVGLDPALIALLRTALGGRADMEIRWSRD
jgi:hypothetical protein